MYEDELPKPRGIMVSPKMLEIAEDMIRTPYKPPNLSAEGDKSTKRG